jgi:FG-GAP-like repeat
MNYTRLLLPIVFFIFDASLGSSQALNLSFAAPVTYSSGGRNSESVAVADVNGDGKPDILVTNLCGGYTNTTCPPETVSVLLGNGDGIFQAAVPYNSGASGASAVAVADVNSDGKPDLIVGFSAYVNPFNASAVSVLLGNGDGTFQTAQLFSSGGLGVHSVAVADVNGDGKPDLLVANQADGTVAVLLGNGDGTFQTAQAFGTGGQNVFSVAVADVNSDGKPDLLVTNFCGSSSICGPQGISSPGSVSVLLGNGDGTFQAAAPYGSGGELTYGLAVADVNGDGKPDLLVANFCAAGVSNCGQVGTFSTGSVGVLLGNGDGTFQAASSFGSGGYGALSVAVADVNGDGKPDVQVTNGCISGPTNCANGTVGVLLGKDDGTFQAAQLFSAGASPVSIAVADVNGDGKPDLGVANDDSTYSSVGVLINTSTPSETTPPTITISARPTTLWPPNGKLAPVTISGTIVDTESGVNASTAAYDVMDEYRMVQPSGSIALGSGGSYSFTILLQPSRSETDKNGRAYTITVSAKDNAGNFSSALAVVTVPHDQGH